MARSTTKPYVNQTTELVLIFVWIAIVKVPLVVQANIFDLAVGKSDVRPDKNMGYQAAKQAFISTNYQDGNFGVGCGATVGKICGVTRSMKSGIGSYAIQIDDLQVGAVVVVNALGDIYNYKTGKQIAGLLCENKFSLCSTLEYMKKTSQKCNFLLRAIQQLLL